MVHSKKIKKNKKGLQAVILAAGASTRTYPLTVTMPKAMLKVANKTIIEHVLDQLDGIVKEAIIIVGYKKEKIMQLGARYNKITLKYVEQKEQLGTGHAVLQAEQYISDRFIVLNADDLISKVDIKSLISHDYAVLAQKVDNPNNYGVFITKSNKLVNVVEKPKTFISNIANVAVYVFNKKIFDLIKKTEKTERREYELTDALKKLARNNDVYCEMIKDYWLPIGYAWDIIKANEVLLSRIKASEIKGIVEKGATLKGIVCVGKGTIIKSGVYIEGPVVIGENCKIGPNCYIRGSTSIGNNCHIGQAVELKNTIIFDKTNVAHLSYVGDSVIGNNSNLGAGTVTANLRHDNKNIRSAVKGLIIDTGRRKLGTIIGDNVHTGIHTSIYPGRKIWPDKTTLPGEIITKDVE